jgi:hypothetical protein
MKRVLSYTEELDDQGAAALPPPRYNGLLAVSPVSLATVLDGHLSLLWLGR